MRAPTVRLRRFGAHEFKFIGYICPARDEDGRIAEYTYELSAGVKPNRYAAGPFCTLKLAGTASRPGVYVITAAEDLRYIGECEDLAGRFGPNGYGHITARNCHDDGQATNCKVNGLIL